MLVLLVLTLFVLLKQMRRVRRDEIDAAVDGPGIDAMLRVAKRQAAAANKSVGELMREDRLLQHHVKPSKRWN